MIITDLSGVSELLTDYQIKERKRVVNGEYSLPFFVFKTERNAHSFPLVAEESIVEYDGQKYRIKKMREYTRKQTPVKEVTAQHEFFDIIDDYQYDTLKGTLNIVQTLNHVFGVTDWTWVNQGAFNSVKFEEFGDGTALELFQAILERYGAEFEITGAREITLKNQIGQTRDAQFRYRHNIKTLYKDVDSSNVSTYIKGFGKDGVTAEYTSPNSSVYGVRHAPPVRDEKFTSQSALLDYLQKVLIDTPNIVIDVEIVELKKQGIPIHTYGLGDTIYLIHEDLGIDMSVRIMEYTDYPESFKSPSVVLANYKPSITKVMSSLSQTSKAVKQLTDADGNLSLRLKRLYRNSDHYSDNTGDWYISPDDLNAYVHIGAGGIDIHRGLLRVERKDGAAFIVDGVPQLGLAVQSRPFYGGSVTFNGQYYVTSESTYQNAETVYIAHDSRYLNVVVAIRAEDSSPDATVSTHVSLTEFGNDETAGTTVASGNVLAQKGTTQYISLVVDLGVPTYQAKQYYLRFRNSSGNASNTTMMRLGRMWLNG